MKQGENKRRWISPRLAAGAVLAALILLGSYYNLAHYPAVWWDEGIFSETAANLAQHGRYALTEQSPDKLNDFDFRISAGPALILPVALAYKLFGVGVTPGRAVAGTYLVLAFLALFGAARRLWGTPVALVAVALAALGTDAFYWGRSVLGDIPALSLFFCSVWFLLKGLESSAYLHFLLGGVFLGLAFDAKEFYGLAFLPPLAVLARQAWSDQRRLILSILAYGAGLALPLLIYVLLKALVLGDLSAAILHFFHQKKLLCHEFFTPLTIGRLYPESLLFLLQQPLFWLGLLGAGWAWKKTEFSLGAQLWVGNFFLWSLVYLTAVFWQRFALPALFLASPLAALFLVQGWARLTAHMRPGIPRWLAPGLLLLVMLLFIPLWGVDYLGQIVTQKTDGPHRIVKYLADHVPSWCLIETPEYELTFLDDVHRFHLMPSYYFVEATPERIVLLNPRLQPYDFNRVGAQLLILGRFGKGVFKQVYPQTLLERDWRRLAQVDIYDIYISRNCSEKVVKRIKNFASATTGRPATHTDVSGAFTHTVKQ